MKQPNIQKINQELLQKTGVDFSRYRNQELTDTMANAVTFPLFFARSLSRPVLLFLGLTLLAIVFTGSGYFKGFLTFPGLLLAVINGILLGLVIFIRRIRNDMNKVFAISSDLSLQVLRDISAARTNLTGNVASFPGFLEIFQGVNAIVILPMLMHTMDRKIPLLGGMAAAITGRFFSVVDKRLTTIIKAGSDRGTQPETLTTPEEMSAWLQAAERVVHYARDNISKVVDKVSTVIAFPFVTVFIIAFLLSSAFVYAAWSWLS